MHRESWQDAAKGVGILLVVWGHVVRGLFTAGLAEPHALGVVDQVIYLFHMPLFFLLAGLNVERSLNRGTSDYMLGKLQTVAFPYFLWSLLQGGLMMAAGGATNGQVGAGDLAAILWVPIGQFWFLYALFVAQIAVLFVPPNRWAWIALAVVAVAATCWLPMNNIAQRSAFALLYLAIGMAGAVGLMQGRNFALASAVVFVATAYFAVRFDLRESWPGFVVPAALAGSALVICLAKALKGPALAVFAYLGERSMTIFVLHVIAAAATRIVLVKLGVEVTELHIVAGVSVGVTGPLVAHEVINRLGLAPWLGLGRWRSTRRAKELPA